MPTLARGLACAATTSLARRLGCAQAGPVADHGGSHLAPEAMAAYGEFLAILERVVVAPAVGQVDSQRVSTPVCSPFESRLMGMLAVAGGHVVPGQPVAWLRVRSGASSAGWRLEGSDRHARASAPPLQVLDLTHYLRHRIAHTGQRSKD